MKSTQPCSVASRANPDGLGVTLSILSALEAPFLDMLLGIRLCYTLALKVSLVLSCILVANQKMSLHQLWRQVGLFRAHQSIRPFGSLGGLHHLRGRGVEASPAVGLIPSVIDQAFVHLFHELSMAAFSGLYSLPANIRI